ncbi:MAG TPA: hypothetical protein VL172_07070 [Kofleriaceae bacterium]|jgi:hypothetical protein|nr:hypothetical protein [Kofleriaceae bacterium]
MRASIVTLLLLAAPALADEPAPDAPTAHAAVSSGEVELGRPFSLFVTVDKPDGVEINLPSSLGLGEFVEEVRRVANDRTLDDGSKVREFELQLIPWVVGDYQVPGIPVTYAKDGVAHQTQSNTVAISVISAIGSEEGSLRDVAPPVGVQRADWQWIILAIVSAVIVLGAIILVVGTWLVRRRRPVRKAAPAAPLRPVYTGSARDVALARLAALEQRLGESDLRPVVFEMSEIVREFLGRCFTVPALDMTTAELARALAARGDLAGILPGLRAWLEEADLVKYAGESPSADEVLAAIDRARSLVDAAWPATPGTAAEVRRTEPQVA